MHIVKADALIPCISYNFDLWTVLAASRHLVPDAFACRLSRVIGDGVAW